MNLCRVCLSTSANRDIRELKTTKKEGSKSYMNILSFCCLDFIQVAEESNTTTKLCSKCFRKILSYHKFKTLALQRFDIASHGVKDDPEIKLENDYKELLSNLKTIDDDDDLGGTDTIVDTIIAANSVKEFDFDKPVRKTTKTIKSTAKHKREFDGDIKTPSIKCKKGYKVLPCKFCDKVFYSYKARSKHKIAIHLGVKRQCGVCGKQVANLSEHMSRIHNPEKPKLQCSICFKLFKLPSFFELHMREHTKENPFECDLCQKQFGNAEYLLRHKRRVHDKEKSHLCQFCSKQYFSKDKLKEHLRSHTGERPYECEDCGKAFYTGPDYRAHKQTHSSIKNFECDHCNSRFAALRYLRAHMRCHTKEKNYPCKYCGVKFGRSDHRNRHQFTAHEKHLGTPLGLPDKADQYAIKPRIQVLRCGVKFGRSDHRNRHQFTAHEKHLGTPLGLPDKADQYAIKPRSNHFVFAEDQ
ncbi:zinc-finger double domain-containing protein [Phthorimaea operculella]|nr:zinc-finger double domain-containing protein [Phthorimaea operculella]